MSKFLKYFNMIYDVFNGFIISIIILALIIYLISFLIKNIKENFNYFTCTMTLNDINPKFKDDYLSLHNRTAKCGPCENAILKLNVNTCPVNEYGSSSAYCKPSGFIESSLGNPITFTYDISSQNMHKFFCIR